MLLCSGCGKSFTRSDNLRRHERESCKRTDFGEPEVKRVRLLQQSEPLIIPTIKCCNKDISRSQIYAHRRTLEHRTMSCTPKCDGIQIINTAFKCRIISYRVHSDTKHTDYVMFFDEVKAKVISLLEDVISAHKSVKVNMETFANYILQTRETSDVKSFNSCNKIFDESVDIGDLYKDLVDTMTSQMSEFEEKDSGK